MSTERMAEIGHLIATQDNRSRQAPIFAVQQRKRVYGFDPAYSIDDSDVVWLHSPYEGVEETMVAEGES